MSRVAVPVAPITRAGVPDTAPTVGDPANGHTVANDGATWVEAENTGDVSHTLSALFANTVDGVTVDPRTWTIPATARLRIGPFPTRLYGSSLQLDVDDAELELSAYRVAAQG